MQTGIFTRSGGEWRSVAGLAKLQGDKGSAHRFRSVGSQHSGIVGFMSFIGSKTGITGRFRNGCQPHVLFICLLSKLHAVCGRTAL